MFRSSVLASLFVVGLSCSAFAQQTVGGCSVLPANNIWNTAIDTLPVAADSATLVTTIGASRGFHADFGSGLWDGGPIGIPFVTVPGTQTTYPASFLYADESDPGPYAVPLNAPIEGGSQSNGDRHAIAIDTGHCVLYELYRAFPGTNSWTGDSGAIFDLSSNALRPDTWTSGDAAGLPIMPGLVTWDEVASGEIRHAIRFTVPQSRRAYVWPARHYASSLTGTQYPRMGERFRLNAAYNISGYPADVQVILRAMKKYGIILADNGSAWFLSGKPDERWSNSNLATLGGLLGSNLEAVDATVLRISPDSGEARQAASVAVSPAAATVRVGHAQAFSAIVTGATGGVTWSVNGVAGGDVVVGTIDASGVYLPPTIVPNPDVVTVRATSVSAPAASGTASVTLIPPPSITSVTPSTLAVGPFTVAAGGAGYVAGSTISFNGEVLPTTYVSPSSLSASGSAPAPALSVPVFVTTPDGETSNTVFVAIVSAQPIGVTVSPTSASVRVKTTKAFTATVQGTPSTAVTWKVNGVAGGNGSVGTISTAGLYKAPTSVPTPATVTVSATSVADPTKSAAAAVTITRK